LKCAAPPRRSVAKIQKPITKAEDFQVVKYRTIGIVALAVVVGESLRQPRASPRAADPDL
jgi:hypothetical protein